MAAADDEEAARLTARLGHAERRLDEHVRECTENGRRILETLDDHAEQRRAVVEQVESVRDRIEVVNTTVLVAVAHSEATQARRLNTILLAIVGALLSVIGDIVIRIWPYVWPALLDHLAGR